MAGGVILAAACLNDDGGDGCRRQHCVYLPLTFWLCRCAVRCRFLLLRWRRLRRLRGQFDRRCRTSQPAVTRTVKHVEAVLGIELFDRSTRSVQITAAGKEFAAVAARILNDLKITLHSMRELSDQRRGQIIISSIMSVANGKLPGLVSTYRRDYPGIELHVRDGVHGTVIEDVRSGTADFGITYLDDLSVRVGSEAFTVVLPRDS